MINTIKNFIKQAGLYNFIIKLIIKSDIVAQAFLVFLSFVLYKNQQVNFKLITLEQKKVVSIIRKNQKILIAIRHIAYI